MALSKLLVADWLAWLIDHHLPAVAFAVLLVILLVQEARRPRQ